MAIPPTGDPARLTPRDVSTRAVRVPLTFALGTSAAIVRAVPLLLVDLGTEEGLIGRTYLFCYTPSGARAIAEHIREALELVLGKPTTPLFALLGVTGTVRMALSAIDMAFWDALAQSVGRPLSHLLGGSLRPLPAYDSRGLGLITPAALADEAEKLLAKGLRALKLRLGYPSLAEDMAALDAVRRHVGPEVSMMVVYNQALTPAEALKRGHALDDHDILWIEEPIAHENYRSYARLTRELRTAVQIGENFNGPASLSRAVRYPGCPLARICRLGGCPRGRAHADRGRVGDPVGPAGQRAHLGRKAAEALGHVVMPSAPPHPNRPLDHVNQDLRQNQPGGSGAANSGQHDHQPIDPCVPPAKSAHQRGADYATAVL